MSIESSGNPNESTAHLQKPLLENIDRRGSNADRSRAGDRVILKLRSLGVSTMFEAERLSRAGDKIVLSYHASPRLSRFMSRLDSRIQDIALPSKDRLRRAIDADEGLDYPWVNDDEF